MSETQLVKSILDALAIEPGVVAWRNSVGNRGHLRFGLGTGSADIICCVEPNGRFVGLECKVADGILSIPQWEWGQSVLRCGGAYVVIHSVLEALRVVRAVKAAKAGGCADDAKHSDVARVATGKR